MNLLRQIRDQEKKWNRAKRIEKKHKKKLFSLLRMQMEKRKDELSEGVSLV